MKTVEEFMVSHCQLSSGEVDIPFGEHSTPNDPTLSQSSPDLSQEMVCCHLFSKGSMA